MVINKYLAEFMGTFILVFIGSMGILSVLDLEGAGDPVKLLVIAFAFGLALLGGIWAVAHVSGAHFNPAVTLGMLADGRISFSDAIGYWIGQFAGATVASLAVAGASSTEVVALTTTTFTNQATAILLETLLTMIFVWVILAARTGGHHAPIAISLTLVGVHLAGIPFSGASVNPARSFGPALVSGQFSGIWVYLIFPLVGGLIAWGLYRLFPVPDPARPS